MLNKETDAWLQQALSDRRAAERVLDRGDHSTFCQCIAKCQQTVEKSIKALVISAQALGMTVNKDKFGHDVQPLIKNWHDNLKYALIGEKSATDVYFRADQFLKSIESEISILCGLAPRRFKRGVPTPRNTEYPFECQSDLWIPPAGKDAFSIYEVTFNLDLAGRTYRGAKKFVGLIERVGLG